MNRFINFVLPSILITAIGLLSSFVTIYNGLGIIGAIVTIILLTFLIVIFYRKLSVVLDRNIRGTSMLYAIENVGLLDIVGRDDKAHPLPPKKLFEIANSEILLSALSAERTFDQLIDDIKQALDEGKKFYVLILHPDSPDIEHLSRIEKRVINYDIWATIKTIAKEQLHQHQGFEIRFRQTIPNFTGILIDSDLSSTGVNPRDENGQIRIQPYTRYSSHHTGIVFHLSKRAARYKEVFEHFSNDMREQWNKDGVLLPELFENHIE